jgi:hypothetical protein
VQLRNLFCVRIRCLGNLRLDALTLNLQRTRPLQGFFDGQSAAHAFGRRASDIEYSLRHAKAECDTPPADADRATM